MKPQIAMGMATAVILITSCLVTSGCGNSSDNSATAAPVTPPANATPGSTSAAPQNAGVGNLTSKNASGAADGASLFAANCAGCHGDNGVGKRRAPVLAGKHTPEAEAERVIANGKGKMPAFGSRLSKEQVKSIATYVASL